ncbi:hypothetical protein D3C78_1705170 [compost metagenome]
MPTQFLGQFHATVTRLKIVQGPTQANQLAIQQLLVELNEVRLAGAAEQHPGEQRHHGGARRKQQGQAAAQGEAAHQAERSSRT